jgi:hypothetical protein
VAWKPDYVTAAQVSEEILQVADDVDDAWIARVATAASRAVDRHTRRQFGLLADPLEQRCVGAVYRADRGRYVVSIPDLMTTTGLAITAAGESVASGYLLEPSAAELDGRPWTLLALPYDASYTWADGERDIYVTAKWGWTAVPPTVIAATLLQAQRFYMRRGSPFGVAGSPDAGSELRLLSKVDPDVGVMLADYVRPAAPR